MEDILGYEREVHTEGELMTSEHATISFGGQKRNLVQNIQASYNQQVNPNFEAGSPDVYIAKGQPMGQLQMQRLVGRRGFLEGLKNSRCGVLDTITIGTDGRTCDAITAGQTIQFQGATIQGLTLGANTGGLQAVDGASLIVPKMSIN